MNVQKRFWTEVTVEKTNAGFEVGLDGRRVKTPAKSVLALPNEALAEMIAAEWKAQEDEIQPETMPTTRMANSVIDKVIPNFSTIVENLAEYGGTDLLCYRATDPAALIKRQAEAWDPLLEWADGQFGRLNVTEGVMYIEQPKATLGKMKDAISGLNAWQIAGFHDLVTISGSLVLALAVISNRISVDDAWNLSRVDENWQTEQWGEDEEAEEVAAVKFASFKFADTFYRLATESAI